MNNRINLEKSEIRKIFRPYSRKKHKILIDFKQKENYKNKLIP